MTDKYVAIDISGEDVQRDLINVSLFLSKWGGEERAFQVHPSTGDPEKVMMPAHLFYELLEIQKLAESVLDNAVQAARRIKPSKNPGGG